MESAVAEREAVEEHRTVAPLERILCTEELTRRRSRPPDYEPESRALSALVKALAERPRAILQTLADTIQAIGSLGAAGNPEKALI